MQQARVHGPGDVRLDEVPIPRPGPKDVVVRVQACGICGSDLGYIAHGGLGGAEPLNAPLPIGHEFAGVVTDVGAEVHGIAPGLRVAVNPDDGLIGGGGAEGAMAPFILIPNAAIGSTLYPIPADVSADEAALAEPLSVALHAMRVVNVTAHDKVTVLGAGPIGLCAVAALRYLGVRDIAIIDRVPSRLERAKALGANVIINGTTESMTEALSKAHGSGSRFGTPFVGTDVFIDVAGAPPLLKEVMGIAKFRMRIAVVALYKQPCAIDLWKMMANEILISGAIALDRKPEFGEALKMIAGHRANLAPLVSHRIEFKRFHEALKIAADADHAAKVVLTFSEAQA